MWHLGIGVNTYIHTTDRCVRDAYAMLGTLFYSHGWIIAAQVLKVLDPSTDSSFVLDYQIQTRIPAHCKWIEQAYVQYQGIAWSHHQVDPKVRVDLEEGLDGIEIVVNDPVVGLALIDLTGWSWD